LPRVGASIRAAFSDYYFHSMRLVPANVVWGAALIVVALVGLFWPLGGLLLLPLLALPTAGIFRLAAGIVRATSGPGWQDILWPYRQAAASTLAVGAAFVAVSLILGINMILGIGQREPAGWALATFAGWGLVAIWSGALVVWPLLVDPARDARPLRSRLRLAAALLLVDPVRIGALAIAIAITIAISTVLTAALLTISVSFVALVACRVVYPMADRLEAAMVGERP
jgi:uncharacterized membrane protein YesL